MTNRSRLAALLGASLAVSMAATGSASADLVPLPPLPTVDTTCLNAPDPVQCEIASLQGTVTGTVTDVTSQPPLIIGGTGGGTTGTGTTSLGGVPTASGGTVQQSTSGHRAVSTKKKRHYRLHRSGHRRRG